MCQTYHLSWHHTRVLTIGKPASTGHRCTCTRAAGPRGKGHTAAVVAFVGLCPIHSDDPEAPPSPLRIHMAGSAEPGQGSGTGCPLNYPEEYSMSFWFSKL